LCPAGGAGADSAGKRPNAIVAAVRHVPPRGHVGGVVAQLRRFPWTLVVIPLTLRMNSKSTASAGVGGIVTRSTLPRIVAANDCGASGFWFARMIPFRLV